MVKQIVGMNTIKNYLRVSPNFYVKACTDAKKLTIMFVGVPTPETIRKAVVSVSRMKIGEIHFSISTWTHDLFNAVKEVSDEVSPFRKHQYQYLSHCKIVVGKTCPNTVYFRSKSVESFGQLWKLSTTIRKDKEIKDNRVKLIFFGYNGTEPILPYSMNCLIHINSNFYHLNSLAMVVESIIGQEDFSMGSLMEFLRNQDNNSNANFIQWIQAAAKSIRKSICYRLREFCGNLELPCWFAFYTRLSKPAETEAIEVALRLWFRGRETGSDFETAESTLCSVLESMTDQPFNLPLLQDAHEVDYSQINDKEKVLQILNPKPECQEALIIQVCAKPNAHLDQKVQSEFGFQNKMIEADASVMYQALRSCNFKITFKSLTIRCTTGMAQLLLPSYHVRDRRNAILRWLLPPNTCERRLKKEATFDLVEKITQFIRRSSRNMSSIFIVVLVDAAIAQMAFDCDLEENVIKHFAISEFIDVPKIIFFHFFGAPRCNSIWKEDDLILRSKNILATVASDKALYNLLVNLSHSNYGTQVFTFADAFVWAGQYASTDFVRTLVELRSPGPRRYNYQFFERSFKGFLHPNADSTRSDRGFKENITSSLINKIATTVVATGQIQSVCDLSEILKTGLPTGALGCNEAMFSLAIKRWSEVTEFPADVSKLVDLLKEAKYDATADAIISMGCPLHICLCDGRPVGTLKSLRHRIFFATQTMESNGKQWEQSKQWETMGTLENAGAKAEERKILSYTQRLRNFADLLFRVFRRGYWDDQL